MKPTGAVAATAEIPTSLPLSVLWGQVRGYREFATHDLFHRRFVIEGDPVRTGTKFRLIHGFGPFRVTRHGRLLRWVERQELVLSDLSLRGVDVGFPHILRYRVSRLPGGGSTLTYEIRGRWTARWVPVVVRNTWVQVVMRLTAFLIMRRLAVTTGPRATTSSSASEHTRV